MHQPASTTDWDWTSDQGIRNQFLVLTFCCYNFFQHFLKMVQDTFNRAYPGIIRPLDIWGYTSHRLKKIKIAQCLQHDEAFTMKVLLTVQHKWWFVNKMTVKIGVESQCCITTGKYLADYWLQSCIMFTAMGYFVIFRCMIIRVVTVMLDQTSSWSHNCYLFIYP